MLGYLKQKKEIEGYQDVLATVKTVEKIAASTVQRLRDVVKAQEDYIQQLQTIIRRAFLYHTPTNHPLVNKRKSGQQVLVLMGGDKGLVGSLYQQVISQAVQQRHIYDAYIPVGEKMAIFVKEERLPVLTSFPAVDAFDEVSREKMTNQLFALYTSKSIAKMDVAYGDYRSLVTQEIQVQTILPFSALLLDQPTAQSAKKEELGLPLFEPQKQMYVSWLLQRYIETFFARIQLDSVLSENASRTINMEHASAKAEQYIRKLQLKYFKDRRQEATQKQLESFTAHQHL